MTPDLLGPKELMLELGISSSQFYRLKAQGTFEKFLVHPPVGRKCYSAYLIDQWKRGEPLETRVFGRKRSA